MKRFIGKCIILLLLCAFSSGCVWKIDGVGSDGFYKNKHIQDYYLSYYRVSSLFCWFIILPPIVFLKMEANAISLDSDEQDKTSGFAVVALINPLVPTKIYMSEDEAWVNKYESVGTQTVTSRYRPHEAELLKHYGLDAYVPNQYQKHELERLPWITDYYYSPNQKQITWQMKEAFWGAFRRRVVQSPGRGLRAGRIRTGSAKSVRQKAGDFVFHERLERRKSGGFLKTAKAKPDMHSKRAL